MLNLLHIENIAVVARAEIAFQPGLNALTGETGAGKSIIIDAIGALLGERTSRDIIRTGEKQAFVSGVFSGCGDAVAACLESLGLPVGEDGMLTVARRVYADGRNLCHVNGMNAPLAALRTLGALLCKTLGQHDSRSLLDPTEHLKLLDRYAGTEALLADYQAALHTLKSIRAEQRALLADGADPIRRRELLTHTIQEIESANLAEGEDERLTERRAAAQHAGKKAAALSAALRALEGFETSAPESVEASVRALTPLCGQGFAELDAVATALTDAAVVLRDSMDTLEAALEASTFSEQELDEMEARLSQLASLKRKYGGSLAAVADALESARTELDRLADAEVRSAQLAEAYAAQYEQTRTLAERLSEARQRAAAEFSDRICGELAYLCMGGSRFSVRFDRRMRDGRVILGNDGIDLAEFYFSANRGEQQRPLAKTASGGELSRIMLALNTVQPVDGAPTLVFDEIDAGISGIAASRVARRLASLAAGGQVLCVTHLPQLAVFADTHFLIRKAQQNDRTLTEVLPLSAAGRVDEIARINSGDMVTDAVRAAAAEQLEQAQQAKFDPLHEI